MPKRTGIRDLTTLFNDARGFILVVAIARQLDENIQTFRVDAVSVFYASPSTTC